MKPQKLSFTHELTRSRGARLGFIAALTVLLAALSVTSALALGRWRDGLPATLVLGQADFTSRQANRGGAANALGLYYPHDVAVDPTSGKLFVADTINNRVLRYPDPVALTNGAAAEAVLGAANFSDTSGGASASRMSFPKGVFVDKTGTLWVADFYNSRVLRFDNAASKTNGAGADGVLGQPDFTSSSSAVTQSGMGRPWGVYVEADGALWVSDVSLNRVLRFDNAASKGNGAAADGVLGQDDFTSNVAATTQDGMRYPVAVWVSSAALFVADGDNHRVLRFDNAASKANGAEADGVLGQADFVSTEGDSCTQNRLGGTSGLSVDASGTLYVADRTNYRVMIFNDAASLANGADANFVLGQPDFSTCTSGATADKMDEPYGVFADDAGQVLWVADENNHRVLRFQANCSAINNGMWDQPATWDCDRVPAAGDNVTIPVTWTVTLNTDTADLFHVTISGTLQNNSASKVLNLTGDWTNQGDFDPGNWITVNFKSNDLQYLSGDTTFYNLATTSATSLDVGSSVVTRDSFCWRSITE